MVVQNRRFQVFNIEGFVNISQNVLEFVISYPI